MIADQQKKVPKDAPSRRIAIYCDSGHVRADLAQAQSRALVWEHWDIDGAHVHHEAIAYTPEVLNDLRERRKPLVLYRMDGQISERYVVRCPHPDCRRNVELNRLWFGEHRRRTFGRLSALADAGVSELDLARLGGVLS